MTGKPIPGSELAEPVWTGLIEWYLPFVVLFFLVYIPLVGVIHYLMGTVVSYGEPSKSGGYHLLYNAFRTAMHPIFDGPLPIGVIHAYMTSLEEEMNDLIVRLLTQFLEIQRSSEQITSIRA